MAAFAADAAERPSDSSSENDFESLFHVIDEEDEVFSFDAIDIRHLPDSQELEITFVFGANRVDAFESKVYVHVAGLDGDVCSSLLVGDLQLKRIVFSLGMCVLQWFWMGFGAARIEIGAAVAEAVALDEEMLRFWRAVYEPMLAEFLYVNRLPDKEVVLAVDAAYVWPAQPMPAPRDDRSWCADAPRIRRWREQFSLLVPLGGGKDSLVVWHMARAAGERPLSVYVSDGPLEFALNWRLPAIVQAMQVAEGRGGDAADDDAAVVVVKHVFVDDNFRRLSRSYLEPCGHPWAAVVLFDALLVAWLTGVSRVSLGFERSADEGNGVFVRGGRLEVNHQYDKSSAFLHAAQRYVARSLAPQLQAASALSDLWELQIARVFCEAAELRPFHGLFLSCNEPVAHSRWCGRCDKCAFICLLLAAWAGAPYVAETVFGGVDLLATEALLPTFVRLVDADSAKPMDCVGTVAEAREAVRLIARREARHPVVLAELVRFIAAHPLPSDAAGDDATSDATGDAAGDAAR